MMKIKHYRNEEESPKIYLDNVIFQHLKWNKPNSYLERLSTNRNSAVESQSEREESFWKPALEFDHESNACSTFSKNWKKNITDF